MHNGLLTLSFSEAVNAASFVPSGITLHNAVGGASTVTLTGGITSSTNGVAVVLNLTVSDLNRLKVAESLATSDSNTFLSATNKTIADMAGVGLSAISATSPQQASTFYDDNRAATLSGFRLDMNSGTVMLNFSETMNISSLSVAGRLTLQSAANSSIAGEAHVTLTGEQASARSDRDVVVIKLLKDDLELIKLADQIGTGISNTFLSLAGSLISDQSGVAVLAISGEAAQQAAEFVNDSTPPQLDGTSFSLSTGVLTMNFTESVRKSTLNASRITLQDAVTGAVGSVVLGPQSSVNGANGLSLTVTLSTAELDQVRSSERYAIRLHHV
jgi:hypothetical protein